VLTLDIYICIYKGKDAVHVYPIGVVRADFAGYFFTFLVCHLIQSYAILIAPAAHTLSSCLASLSGLDVSDI